MAAAVLLLLSFSSAQEEARCRETLKRHTTHTTMADPATVIEHNEAGTTQRSRGSLCQRGAQQHTRGSRHVTE